MSQRQVSQWRTVGLVVLVCVLMLIAFLFVVARGMPVVREGVTAATITDQVVRIFEALTTAFTWLVIAVAVKAGGEAVARSAASGPGFKGIARVLMTDAKPGEPAVPPQDPPAGGQP